MALRATLLSANRLAGCVALSTYFPGDMDAVKGKLVESPVFQVSGKQEKLQIRLFHLRHFYIPHKIAPDNHTWFNRV